MMLRQTNSLLYSGPGSSAGNSLISPLLFSVSFVAFLTLLTIFSLVISDLRYKAGEILKRFLMKLKLYDAKIRKWRKWIQEEVNEKKRYFTIYSSNTIKHVRSLWRLEELWRHFLYFFTLEEILIISSWTAGLSLFSFQDFTLPFFHEKYLYMFWHFCFIIYDWPIL